MPANTVRVARPSPWGNPFTVAEYGQALAVEMYRSRLEQLIASGTVDLSPLRGRNLACWCKPGTPCHADVLLEFANRPVVGQEQQ